MIDLRKQLQVGQVIAIAPLDNGLKTVAILGAGAVGHRVMEVACDYLVAEDETAGVRMRLPVHCIQSVSGPIDPALHAA